MPPRLAVVFCRSQMSVAVLDSDALKLRQRTDALGVFAEAAIPPVLCKPEAVVDALLSSRGAVLRLTLPVTVWILVILR
jgi:hypothetical protein